jgi:hypothetical protein
MGRTFEDYARVIDGLLRKAEQVDTKEAESLTAKATRMMTEQGITEDILARHAGKRDGSKLEVIEATIDYTGIFGQARFYVGDVVARAFGCETLYLKRDWTRPKAIVIYVIGIREDVAKVTELDRSIQLQLRHALETFSDVELDSWMGKADRFKSQREFIFGYATGLRKRLADAHAAGEEDAVQVEAERVATEEHQPQVEAESTARKSVELVVRDKATAVEDYMKDKHSDVKTTRGGSLAGGGYEARRAGIAAGLRSDIGQKRIGQ